MATPLPPPEKQEFATPDDVAELADQWTSEQLICRLRGHRFTVPITAIENTRYGYIFVRLGCAGECGVTLKQEISVRTGHAYWQNLDYSGAQGYLSRHGRIVGDAKDEVRRQWIRRVIKPTKTKRDEPPHNPQRSRG